MEINSQSKIGFIDQNISKNNTSFLEKRAHTKPNRLAYAPSQPGLQTQASRREDLSSEPGGKAEISLFLVTMYKGIGDAVLVGLSTVDQIIKEAPHAFGKIAVLCKGIQAEIFEHDPRINRIILTDTSLYSPSEMTMWLKGIKLDAHTAELVHFLRDRHYAAVFAFMFTPGFYLRLHSTIVYPNFLQLGKDLLALFHQVDVPMSKIVRRMVSNYFGKMKSIAGITDEIPIYLNSEQVKNAQAVVKNMKKRSNISAENGRLLVVATDTTSVVTRPPVDLLAKSIADASRNCHNLIVCILQGYTDANAAQNLFKMLTDEFEGRIFLLPAKPGTKLLDVTALIDQSDVFVTGDTGLMHLAAATKMLGDGDNTVFRPNNSVKIIALFGGTNPSFYGYSKRTIILGKGRKEQMAFIPGIAKESYDPKGKNLFDHISPQQVTEAILS